MDNAENIDQEVVADAEQEIPEQEDEKQSGPPRRKVQDFFDNEYLNYAKYVVESRAIPSVIDGFKPTQRKVAHAANKIWKTGKEKPLKVFQLAGNVAATTFYHHGGASLEGAIVTMAQTFKNSMPIFQGIGQFGSLRSPEAGAPRYIGVTFNDNFRLLYQDFDLVTPQHEEGEEIEPRYFLPIIPTVLLNGGSGIAVGFATNILNRHPLDLIDACLAVLNGEDLPSLRPWINGFHGTFARSQDNVNGWIIKGSYNIKNTSTLEITEVPPSFTYEKYEALLDGLIEKGILTSYDDNSSERMNYTLKFPRVTLADLQKRSKLDETLKMIEKESENLTTLDENGKLKVFNSSEEIVRYFVDFRIKYYVKRKIYLLAKLSEELKNLENRARFISEIIAGNLVINNRKKSEIDSDLKTMSFDKVDNSYSYLTSMPIHSLTKEKFEEIQKLVNSRRKTIEKIQKTSPDDMYRTDLKELRTKLQ
jgi:DNA topoisomerase-2